jgi:threonine synthase
VRVDGDFDRALSITMKVVSEDPRFYLMNSVNPFRIEGQKTSAFEIFEQLGGIIPDFVVLPVGNAGNISAYWKGFNELRKWGITRKVPRMIGVQAAGAAPIAQAYSRGEKRVIPWKDPKTVASAIRIGNPVSWRKALTAIQESKGASLAVTDEEIMAARNSLASDEGIFVEAASAAPIAALSKIKESVGRDSTVVCIATGNGLKDQESVHVEIEKAPLASDAVSLLRALVNR